jgi:hypothetical protein
MSSGLILNMNSGQNGVSRELEKFTWLLMFHMQLRKHMELPM